nr:hypothetical protein Iba_chr13cCG18440 [Ipomoea batatas]
MMQPYEEEITEDTKNKILAIMEEFKQDMANMREEWRQERRQRTSSLENEEGDTHGNTFEHTYGSEYENVEENGSVEGKENRNIWDLSAKCDDDLHANSSNNCESDSFETHDVNPSNSCENVYCGIHDNAFENDSCDVNGVNSFNSNDNDGLEFLLDLNDVEFDTFHDNCLDDAIYIHDLLGEEKEETDGDLRDVLLSNEKEEEKESVTIEKENEEENFENKNALFEEVHCKIIEEKKTRNESVREQVDEKNMRPTSYEIRTSPNSCADRHDSSLFSTSSLAGCLIIA